MNWLKKGPELKAPKVEVPPFLADLYYDLRERRLLPILVLAVVAIAAVPFLLGNGSEEEEEPAAGAVAVASGPAKGAHFTVVESKPGLRDYHKRLTRSPTNPFKQRFTGSPRSGPELNPETTTNPEGGGTIPTGEAPPGEVTHHLTFFAIAIDVRISKSGGKESGDKESGGKASGAGKSGNESTVKHKVLPLTSLPGEKTPVVTYMGPSHKGKPIVLVSTDVRSEFGEGICVSGGEVCQLLELELGMPETFVYGPGLTHYTITVLKIGRVVTGHTWPGLTERPAK